MAVQDEKLTVEQLAKKLKSKYPQYIMMDDSALVSKVIEKYPQYQNVLKKKTNQTKIWMGKMVHQMWEMVVWILQRLKITHLHTL